METQFDILSYREECKLTPEELKEYYQNLREYVKDRKLTNTTPGATTISPKLKNATNKIATSLAKVLAKNKELEWIVEGTENIPDGPVIFANTHQGLLDNIVWIPGTDKHAILLHSIKTNKLLLCAQYNTGLVLVRKGDKEHSQAAKLDMMRLLLDGHSIAYFPESTWCLSPNKLHLPLNFGFLDIAKKTHVPVVPVIHEYTYDTSDSKGKITKIHSKYAQPIYVKEEDNLSEKLEEYEEIISTIKWELMAENGTITRDQISELDYINFLQANQNNLKMGGISIDEERRRIYGSTDEFYKFHHLNEVPFDENNQLKDTDEVQKIKKLNREHYIKM